jgi:hypothetical protein
MIASTPIDPSTGEQETVERTARIEIEDDQRCADCESTEAGSCFFCKVD